MAKLSWGVLTVGALKKSENEPHAKVVASENAEDFHRICAAKTREGNYCLNFPMGNGRCRMHGGLSTGPKTTLGKHIASKNSIKHGRYCREVLGFEMLVRTHLQKACSK